LTLIAQGALLAAALLARVLPLAPLRIARYYLLVTAFDRGRSLGPPAPGQLRRLGEGRGNTVRAS